ncbi:MAG: carboxypeptidase regulatory-like domain-containing protein, partial [Candidatus Acidiferrales bacterium]
MVPKVNVTAISKQYGFPHVAVTDSTGSYRMDGLQPGIYSVTFSAPGFSDLIVGNAILSGSVSTTVDGKLQLSTVKSTVEVSAGAAQTIDTQSGQLGESLGHTEVMNLPYTSLNPAELALTLPGVQDPPSTASFTNGFGFSVNGTRPRANNFLIDGQDDNDNSIAGQAFQPTNVGAIQEVTILTNSYSAEYGRGGGSITNYIYKSGSNDFHGDAWEINRNSAFAAIPANDKFLGATSNPRDNENTFGFDIGGPVLKDKLFFFGTMQWDRERQSLSGPQESLPTAAGIATLQSLPPNPNISLLLAGLGNLVSPGVAGVQDIQLGNDPSGNPRPAVQEGFFQLTGVPVAANDRQEDFRVDWNMGSRDSLTASYLRDDSSLNPDFFANSGALPQWETLQGGPSQLFRGQWLHTVSNVLVNEMRFSYTNIDFAFSQTPATLTGPLANIPEIDFGSDIGFPSLGVSSGFPQGRGHKTWQAQEALSYTVGRHTIKGGIDLTFLSVRDEIPFNSRGDLSYNTGGGYTSLGNFIDDFSGKIPAGASKVFGNPVVNPSVTLYMPYIQDTWRVKDNLTLDLGLRYEYWGTVENYLQYPAINMALGFGVPGAVFPNMYAYPQKPDKNNFAPRVGFAYTPHWQGMRGLNWLGDGRSVIRGGYGIYYDGLFTNILDNTAGSVPNANGGNLVPGAGRGLAALSTLLPTITPTLDPMAIPDTIANNLVNPMTQQWNLDVQRELPGKFVLTVAYVGTRGEHLFANTDLNGGTGQFDAFGNIIRLNPNFNEIAVRSNAGDSWYNSGQLELERRFRTDFTMRASYTYSKFNDDTSE